MDFDERTAMEPVKAGPFATRHPRIVAVVAWTTFAIPWHGLVDLWLGRPRRGRRRAWSAGVAVVALATFYSGLIPLLVIWFFWAVVVLPWLVIAILLTAAVVHIVWASTGVALVQRWRRERAAAT